MKRLFKLIGITSAFLALATSCLKDLDQVPLNQTDVTSENAYDNTELPYLNGLTKIYFEMVSNDLTDLNIGDGGASELIRAYWSLNETSTDEAKCAWGDDAWVRDINVNTWSDAANDAALAVYARTLHGVTFTNEYLKRTTDDLLDARGCSEELKAKIHQYRAEARFLRAFYYFVAMDVFGSPAFVTEDSPFGKVNPKQASREQVFNYIESELLALVADDSAMPAARSNYPRADKGSCYGLLARLYLNAEVYTKKARWEDAKKACEKAIGLGYELARNYADLFRGDNGENPDANKEFLFVAAYDATRTQSYGGTTLLTFGTVRKEEAQGDFLPTGVKEGWGGMRTTTEFVKKFFNPTVIPATDENGRYINGNYTIADNRGQFFYLGEGDHLRYEDIPDNTTLYNFLYGWSCFKFNNAPHDQTNAEFLAQAKLKERSDIDFPIIRLAEIYLIYAEACLNLDDATNATALGYLKELTDRAGVAAPTAITKDYLIAERARELMWEAHRRTDLIRWGLFNTDTYLWPWKGGSKTGKGFAEYMNIFAIPPGEMSANPDLVQNPGYND
jgi:hypothetical protein